MLFFQAAKANSVIGSEISYTYQGNQKYKIQLRVYRDCKYDALSIPTYFVSAANNGKDSFISSYFNFNRISIQNITHKCWSDTNNYCNPQNTSKSHGIEMHLFEADLDLTSAPFDNWIKSCCELKITAKILSRQTKVATISTANSGIHITCGMNLCNINRTVLKYNNSGQYLKTPHFQVCSNNATVIPVFCEDTIDNDEMFYSMIPGRNEANLPVAYVTPYTYKNPLKPYCIPTSSITCTPNPNAKPARGFYLDSIKGFAAFTPTLDEIALLTYQSAEYRKDTLGKSVIVGWTSKEQYVFVEFSCGYNNNPLITGVPSSISICEGETINFSVNATDDIFSPNQKITDTVELETGYLQDSSQFIVTSKSAWEKTGQFTWKTKSGMGRMFPYVFSFYAKDGRCGVEGKDAKIVAINVKPVYPILQQVQIDSLCGRVKCYIKRLSKMDKTKYQWFMSDALLMSVSPFGDSAVFQLEKGGMHTCNASSIEACTKVSNLTFNITFGNVDLNLAEVALCYYKDTQLSANFAITKAPYSYNWYKDSLTNLVDTTISYTLTSQNKSTYLYANIIDKNGCSFTKKILVYKTDRPVYSLNPKTASICGDIKQQFRITPNYPATVEWSSGEKTNTIYKNEGGKYAVKVTDLLYGCSKQDTVTLVNFFKPQPTNFTRPAIVCKENAKLIVDSLDQGYKTNYDWFFSSIDNYLTSNRILNLDSFFTKFKNKESDTSLKFIVFKTVFTSQGNCSRWDTLEVKFNLNTTLNLLPNFDTVICRSKNQIYINSAIDVNKYTAWDWNGFSVVGKPIQNTNAVKGNTALSKSGTTFNFNPILCNNDLLRNQNYKEKLFLKYTDSLGCGYSDSSLIIAVKPGLEATLINKTFCQQLSEINVSTLLSSPLPSKALNTWNLSCLQAPVGVDSLNRFYSKDTSLFSPVFTFGKMGENKYVGQYLIKYCVTELSSACVNCDQGNVDIVTVPQLTHTQNVQVLPNAVPINLLNYFKIDGKIATLKQSDEIKLIALNGSNSNFPMYIPKVENKSFFNSAAHGGGVWSFELSVSNTCGNSKDTFNLTVNGAAMNTKNLSSPQLLSIFPNPNSGKFILSSPQELKTGDIIEIFNANGKLIHSVVAISRSTELEIDLKSISSGIYWIKINQSYPTKFVVTN